MLLTYRMQQQYGFDNASRYYRGGLLLVGWFEPLSEWRDVSAYPWRKRGNKQEIASALRAKVSQFLPKPKMLDECAVTDCHQNGTRLRYHHLQPSFKSIVDQCMTLVTEKEIETLFNYDKFAPGICSVADFIPNDHPAVQRLEELHRTNEWCWYCEWHHRLAHGREK